MVQMPYYVACDNITILGQNMNREQALAKIGNLIFEITSEYERGLAVGFINASFLALIIDSTEYKEFFNLAMAE